MSERPPRDPELEAFVQRLVQVASEIPEGEPIVGVFVVLHVPSGLSAVLGTEPFDPALATGLLLMALKQVEGQAVKH